MEINNHYVVIMAGGVGSRLWPMSRTANPKQFHDLMGTGKSLLRQTYERFLGICPIENFYIVTSHEYEGLVKRQLPELREDQVLTEPDRRNTGPCVAYACFKIEDLNKNAVITIAAADHYIIDEENFRQTILLAVKQAQHSDCLITLGIKPTRPDTGYGYIQFTDSDQTIDAKIKKVKTFAEKPDLEHARQFLESGDFYWNSGIFIWSVKSVLKGIEKHMPHTNGLFSEGRGFYNTPKEKAFINTIYQQCKNLSIDYGLMEKAKNVFVILSDFGWSDLGTWGSLYSHIPKDENQNAVVGKNIRFYNSRGNMVNVTREKLVVIQGLEDYIVVESEGILLICKKEDEQKIKQFVNDIKLEKGDKFI
ncbi:MAG TPA: mannose-1-phosphate guanylyltransferase [Flavobacteriales bacterium]|nr:mannose-1-phosphate guanylyltransferase [Flavobacteriales bacterium]